MTDRSARAPVLGDFPIAFSGSVAFLACCRISHVVFVFGQSLKLWLGSGFQYEKF